MSDAERLVATRIIQLYKSGVPSSHIARRLGCERKTVSRVIRGEIEKNGDRK
jgi:DNA invertase Pin-like site-specific DNA recombinase